ncbi:hypothetical protein [uncultured Paracoccus sp.]|uniref:hypothetical protein n=1 Tax=uncultured Paracoccus sp. TaxID=189685 RepID=UPI0025F47AAC|nr:hypothetical protein [uncultured Paracoccus sp.]
MVNSHKTTRGAVMTNRWRSILEFFGDELKKWVTRVAILGVAITLAYLIQPTKDRLQLIWNSPDQLRAISEKLDILTAEVQRATGEDRVIHEAAGQTYVTEPVFVGDQIALNMVVRRTRIGSACTMLRRVALFTDETNIATPGPAKAAERQIGTADTPLRIVLDVPPQVRAGRVTVHLSLEFDCGGKRVFDATRPTAFMLLER